MKTLKYLTLFSLFAIIRSSEVRRAYNSHHMFYTALCVNFDIMDGVTKMDSGYQCGGDWDVIEKGIRDQLKEKNEVLKAEIAEQNYMNNLNKIKDEKIGKEIGL